MPMAYVSRFSRFVPRVASSRLAQGDVGRGEPWQLRLDGALLFLDIAGFVELTHALTNDQPDGVEKVTGLVEEYFGAMTEMIVSAGGDVVSLAGDSIAAFWPASADARQALALAARCSLSLHEAARKLQAKGRPLIRSRAALSLGPVTFSGVGRAGGRMFTVLSGEALAQASAGFHEAAPGETFVCAAAARLLGEFCQMDAAGQGGAILVRINAPTALFTGAEAADTPDVADEMLVPYVPRFLVRESSSGMWQRFAEFRHASIVVVNLHGIDDSLGPLQHLVSAMQEALDQQGGALEQLTVDEKGLIAIGAFGLPAHSHFDDARRSLRAGLAIESRLRAEGWQPHIGITSGLLYCCEFGTRIRSHFAIYGPSVNLAARLASSAAGLFCDGATAEAAGRNFAFSIPQELSIKGLEGNFRFFRPEHETPAREAAPRGMFGRDDEMRTVERRLDDFTRGSGGGLLAIAGAPGIGKSRVLREAISAARNRNCRTIATSPREEPDATPFGLWLELTGDDAQGEVSPMLRIEAEWAGKYAPGTWAARLKAKAIQLLARPHERPIVLAIDDLHNADDESIELLARVVDEAPGCLCIVTLTTSGARERSAIAALLRKPEAAQIILGALDREATGRHAADVLSVADIPGALKDHLHLRTGGHPLYCKELALALRSAGRIRTAGGICRIDKPNELDIDAPPSLQAVVNMRIDSLTAGQQELLKTASVLGQRFTPELLRVCVTSMNDNRHFEAGLSALESEEFLSRGEREELHFKHPLTREIIYSIVPGRLRREIHSLALRALSAQEARHAASGLSTFAWHAEQAGEFPEAIDCIERQIALARERYANREAIRLQQHAFDLAARHGLAIEPEIAAAWWVNMADSHQELSEHGRAEACYREALKALSHPAPASMSALAVQTAGQVSLQAVRRSVPVAQRAKAQAGNRERLAFLAHVHQRLSEVSFFQNQPLAVLYHTLCASNLAEASGSNREIAISHASLAIGLGLQGMDRIARYYSRIAAVSAQGADENTRAYVCLLTTVMAFGQGDWNVVQRNGDEACRLFYKVGDEFRLHQTRFLQLFGFLLVGEFDVAERLHAEMAQSPACREFQQPRFWTVAAALMLDMARNRDAAYRIRQLQELIVDSLDLSDRLLGHGILARAMLDRSETREALAAAEAGLRILLQNPPAIGGGYVIAASACAEVLLEQVHGKGAAADREAAVSRADAAVRALKRYAQRVRVARPRILLLQGRLAELRGHRAASMRLWRRGMRIASSMGMKRDCDLLGRAMEELVARSPAGLVGMKTTSR